MSCLRAISRICARLAVAGLVVTLVLPKSRAIGQDDFWASPPGWDNWLDPDDWKAVIIRAEDDRPIAPPPVQPESRRSRPNVDNRRLINVGLPGDEPLAASEAAIDTGAAVVRTPSSDFTVEQTPEIGRTIERSDRVQTIKFQQRSPISLQPNIRGYQGEDIYVQSDGLFWGPIRPDLDSMIGRIDPSLFEDVAVISGPYGLRYGPGFSFLRVNTIETPRNPNGYESNFRTGISTRTNGGQLYGRQTVLGGGTDWGYVFNYGGRVGGDYKPGGNSVQPPVPGSYTSQAFHGQLGFDLSPDSRLEFRYQRLDDTDTEYALQFFDVNYLGADAFSVHYIKEDPCGCGSFSAMGWYSHSRYHGDTLPRQPNSPYYSVSRVEAALDERLNVQGTQLTGFTAGKYTIAGGRVNKTFGDVDSTQLSIGVDVRHITQRIQEDYLVDDPIDVLPDFATNLPRGSMVDPGVYSELTVNWLPFLSSTLGSRVDWVHAHARASEIRPGGVSNLDPFLNELDQNDVLYAFYLSNELAVSCNWNVRLAAGYAERAPSLLERYADGLFVSAVQTGLSRVIGTPTLDKEHGWQIDLAVTANYDRWRGRAAAFYSWVDDPITFIGFPALDPTGAYRLRYTHGSMFTRAGFELLGERDATEMITAFGTLRYLEGRDLNVLGSLDRPMTGIYPLESRVGVRLHDDQGGNTWGLEFSVRIVDVQDSVGSLRIGTDVVTAIDDNFEQSTPGFTTSHIRGYYNVTSGLTVVAGVENLFDRTYLEHLNLRLPEDQYTGGTFPATSVLSPGITPYVGAEWNY